MAENNVGFKPHWFGDYELLRLLGVGGMAEVFLARTTGAHGFKKLLVVKRILERLRDDSKFVGMFIGEAKRAVMLQHANIVQILSLEEHKGWPYIVMEYIHGKNLQQVLTGASADNVPLPFDFGVHSVAEMLKGLSYAHDARGPDGKPLDLLHRDITPENIFVSFDGEVKLGDFGVAHSRGKIERRELRGKLGYVAPEVLEDVDLDQRSDIFSAGVVLWEVLAQRKLFVGETAQESLYQIAKRVPEPPSTHNPQVAPDLDKIVAKALVKNRDGRYQSAQEFEEALSDYLYARRMRWTRRRIGEVMVARYPDDSKQPSLPPEVPRNPQTRSLADPIDFSDLSASRMRKALKGAVESQVAPIDTREDGGWGVTVDSQILEGPPPSFDDIDGSDFDEMSTVAERLVLHLRDAPVPVPLSIEALIDKVATAPRDVVGIGPSTKSYVGAGELAPLLYWDALNGLPKPNEDPASADDFKHMSLTRLLYEVSVRRMTGTLVLEDSSRARQRMILLRDGLPAYVYSNEGNDGIVAMLYRQNMVEPTQLFRAVEKVVDCRVNFEQALIEVLRELGEANAVAKVWRFIAGLLLRRLYTAFNWRDGHYKAYKVLAGHSPYAKPLPSLLGSLSSAVRRSHSREELVNLMHGHGDNAVVVSEQRQSHLDALALKPVAQAIVNEFDGKRSLPLLLQRAELHDPEAQHEVYAALYVLKETRVVEFF